MGNRRDFDEPAGDEADGATDMTRRAALGRLGLYTSPVMVAMLMSEKAVAATFR